MIAYVIKAREATILLWCTQVVSRDALFSPSLLPSLPYQLANSTQAVRKRKKSSSQLLWMAQRQFYNVGGVRGTQPPCEHHPVQRAQLHVRSPIMLDHHVGCCPLQMKSPTFGPMGPGRPLSPLCPEHLQWTPQHVLSAMLSCEKTQMTELNVGFSPPENSHSGVRKRCVMA